MFDRKRRAARVDTRQDDSGREGEVEDTVDTRQSV